MEEAMAQPDSCVTIVPYFKVHDGKLDEFRNGCGQFIEATKSEPGCLYYGFTFNGNEAHCREGYTDADALLAHLNNVGAMLQEALKIADITRLEVHGPAAELLKLKEPLKDLGPAYFELLDGFRK
jgi:quinol monooxygenase YgiN